MVRLLQGVAFFSPSTALLKNRTCWNLMHPEQCWTCCCNCVAVFGGGDMCNSGKAVNSGFGKGYVYLTKSKEELKREFLHVKVNYKVNKVKIMVITVLSSTIFFIYCWPFILFFTLFQVFSVVCLAFYLEKVLDFFNNT